MVGYEDFHGYGSLTEWHSLCGHFYAIMQVDEPSVAGVKPIQHAPFSQQVQSSH